MNSAAVPPDNPPTDNPPPDGSPSGSEYSTAPLPEAGSPPARSVSKLPLFIMAAIVLLAIVLVVLLAAVRGNTQYDAGTPEATLQEFLIATLEDRDFDDMFALLTQGARARCRTQLNDGSWERHFSTSHRAELESMLVLGDEATALVRFRRSSSDPFSGSSYSFVRDFTLVKNGESWLIDESNWPRRLQSCSDRDQD